MAGVAWSDVCQLCAAVDDTNAIFTKYVDDKNITALVLKYLSIRIKNKSKICQSCGDRTVEFHKFATNCGSVREMMKKHDKIVDREHLWSLMIEYDVEKPLYIKTENDFAHFDSGDPIGYDAPLLVKRKDSTRRSPRIKNKKNTSSTSDLLETSPVNVLLKYDDTSALSDDMTNTFEYYAEITDEPENVSMDTNDANVHKIDDTFETEDSSLKKSAKRERKKIQLQFFSYLNFQCHVCQSKFENWTRLYKHVRDVHNETAKVKCTCNKYLTASHTLRYHIKKHSTCKVCNKSFMTKDGLKSHTKLHVPRNELPYVCSKCGKHFLTPHRLKSHENIHLPKEERYVWPCDKCDLKFTDKFSLKNHNNSIHDKIKLYVCDLCGHSFVLKTGLLEHRRTHSSTKDFKCEKCDKGFKTLKTLDHHRDSHKDTAYKCPHCPKLLNTKLTLRNHLVIHTDRADVVCKMCDRRFKRRKDMINHMKVHTGQRPYSCPWCQRTFTNPSNFRVHKRRMHPKEFELADKDNPYMKKNDFDENVKDKKIIEIPKECLEKFTNKSPIENNDESTQSSMT